MHNTYTTIATSATAGLLLGAILMAGFSATADGDRTTDNVPRVLP